MVVDGHQGDCASDVVGLITSQVWPFLLSRSPENRGRTEVWVFSLGSDSRMQEQDSRGHETGEEDTQGEGVLGCCCGFVFYQDL